MKELNKIIENYLIASNLGWILDYMKLKEACEVVLKPYEYLTFEEFEKGILYLKITDRRKYMEFYYKKLDIIRAINALVGKKLVKEIKFK
ncbi:MAG: DUF721 domain-containing protein [candidate division WOR-3 bacterium]|nr:DUF721 domain-containing protein [candidate division WOR-3 bacterium]